MQNMEALASCRGELCVLGHECLALQQGEYVGVGARLAPMEAQQHEALQVYKVCYAHCGVMSSNVKLQKLFLQQSRQREDSEEVANQEHEQGEQEATNESCDLEVCGMWAQACMLYDIMNTGLEAYTAVMPRSSDDRELSSECSEVSLPGSPITNDM
jgi:hypothetical protein